MNYSSLPYTELSTLSGRYPFTGGVYLHITKDALHTHSTAWRSLLKGRSLNARNASLRFASVLPKTLTVVRTR